MGWAAAARQMVRELVGLPRPLTLDLPAEHTFDTSPRPVDQVIASMRMGEMTRVSRTQALSVAAVQRGRNELCSIATLPLRLYQGLDVVDNALFRQFDLDVPNVVHLAMTVEDLAFESIAWWEIVGTDFNNYPAAVRRVDPCMVTLDPPGKGTGAKPLPVTGGPPLYGDTTVRTGQYVWIDRDDGRGPQPVSSKLMIRFDSPNPGILTANARAIRIAMKLDRLTEMYSDNPALREYFTDSDDPSVDPMDDDEIDAFLAEYGAMRQTRPYGYIPSTLKRADVTSPSPRDLTLAELQQQVNVAIANGLGVDPEDIGVSTTSRTYQNEDARRRDKINRMCAPYMRAITDRLSMGDVTRRGYTVQFDLTDYLKPDPAGQAAYWKALQDMGVTDAEEIRGWAKLSGPPPATAQRAAPPAVSIAASRYAHRPPIQLGDITPGRQFAAPGPAYTFNVADFAGDVAAPTVDTQSRTITGLAVPYNAVANKYGLKYSFAPGSLEYSSPERMAHLKDHTTPVGFHRSIKDTPAGPVVELAVLDGPEGSPAKAERDQLLYDAANGLYSGLSVGVDFNIDPEAGDVEYDAEQDLYRVVRATWRETTTTYMPAFDDARVTKVAASLTGGPMDPCPHCGQRHAPNIACATFARQLQNQPAPEPAPAPAPAPGQPSPPPGTQQSWTVTPEQWAAFMAWAGGQGQGQPAPQPALTGPVPVNPHHGPAQVNEPLPYRYDRKGNMRAGTHDFSSDIAAAYNPNYKGDIDGVAAGNRIGAWLKHAFDPDSPNLGALDLPGPAAQQQFAITPANVVSLNYPANRPDLYVDQLDYLYPMYQAFNKGTLDMVTPFVLPKFNSSSGLVADHVTGTEPTPGAFTATSQTITPSPLSGKVEMTREVFDQGGNPQASGLIWRQMVRGWYEGIEAAIQAFFVAQSASIPDINLGIAVTDAAMDQALASAITALQFIRGGDRFSKVFTQIDLYQKLAKAVDTTNRPLYPSFGAMNASGSMGPEQNYLNVRGKTFVPEWATAATGTVAASSWMMDPDVIGIWLSTPQRIDLAWRVAWVDIGIWGYKALAITDFTRTRELIYDPV